MSDCCPLCGHDLGDVLFYVRWFEGRYLQTMTKEITPFKGMVHRSAVSINGRVMHLVDIVNMETGRVFRNDLKRPLPNWLKAPLKRAIIAKSGELPLIYKNSAVEKASRNPAPVQP